MSDTIEFRRACDCDKATASGPRIVMQPPVDAPGGWVFTLVRVPMACDECDTPWERIETGNQANSAPLGGTRSAAKA
jgi:hypothetical protein